MPLGLVLAPCCSGAQRMKPGTVCSVVQCGQCICGETLLHGLGEWMITEMGQMWVGILVWYRSATNTNVSV